MQSYRTGRTRVILPMSNEIRRRIEVGAPDREWQMARKDNNKYAH